MKVGDRVKLQDHVLPRSRFRTGVVREVDNNKSCYAYQAIRVKRDKYRGHEYTWWLRSDWKRMKQLAPAWRCNFEEIR